MYLVHLFEAVEHVHVVGLLFDDAVEMVGAVSQHHDRNLVVAQCMHELHGLGQVVILVHTTLIQDKTFGQMIFLPQDFEHVFGHRLITAVKEAGVYHLHVVGLNVIMVDNRLAVNLIEGYYTLGDLARLAGATLHEHAFYPSFGTAIERIGHGEYRREIAAGEPRCNSVVDAVECVYAMTFGRAYDAVAGVPTFLAVDVAAREFHTHAILVEQCRETLVRIVLRRIQDVVIIGIVLG